MTKPLTQENVKAAFQDWFEFVKLSPKAPMSHQDARIFAACALGDGHEDFPPEAIKSTPFWKVVTSRAEWTDIQMSNGVAAFITATARSFGDITILLSVLKGAHVFDGKSKPVNMTDLTYLFPVGFPTNMAELWDMQKGFNNELSLDNVLDHIARLT
jgi:hypothetical protein